MNMKNLYITLAVLCVSAALMWIAMATMPKTDNCTPNLIARHTNVIISHKDCITRTQCTITPTDVRKFNNSRTRLKECVIEIGGGKDND